MNDELINMLNNMIQAFTRAYPEQEFDPSRIDYHVAQLIAEKTAVDARCRAYEAALTDVDQLISYPEESGCARGDVGCLLDKVRKVAFDALMATSAATDGSARDGNGEAGT